MAPSILSDNDQAHRERLVGMARSTLLKPREAGLVAGLSIGALSNRRAQGMWPFPVKIPGAGRIVRYRLGDLLALPDLADRREHDSTARQSAISQ